MSHRDSGGAENLCDESREANRSFKKTVRRQILPHYRKVAAFTGKGAFARIKVSEQLEVGYVYLIEIRLGRKLEIY
jgi:hypothetical protein